MDAKAHADYYREALSDLEALDAQRAELLAVVNYHRKKAGISERGDHTGVNKASSTPTGKFAELTHKQAAETVLQQAQRPLSTIEIVDRMIAAGYPCKDKPVLRNSLFARMSKAPDVFKKVRPGVWKLANETFEFEIPSREELLNCDGPEEPVGAAGVGSTRHANGRV